MSAATMQFDSDTDAASVPPAKKRSKMRLVMLLALLCVVLSAALLALGASGNTQFSMDINGEPLGGVAAVSLGVLGVIVGALAVAFAIVAALVVVAGATVVAVLAVAVALGAVLLAFSPLWLPVVAVVMFAIWNARR